MATSSNYGHVKLSSSFSSTGSNGVAASEAAVSNCYNNLNSKLKQGNTTCGTTSYTSFGTLASGLTCNWCNIVHHTGMQMLTISMDLTGSMAANTAIFTLSSSYTPSYSAFGTLLKVNNTVSTGLKFVSVNTSRQIMQSTSSNATQLTFTITFFYN